MPGQRIALLPGHSSPCIGKIQKLITLSLVEQPNKKQSIIGTLTGYPNVKIIHLQTQGRTATLPECSLDVI